VTQSVLVEYATLAVLAALALGFYLMLLPFQGAEVQKRELEIHEAVNDPGTIDIELIRRTQMARRKFVVTSATNQPPSAHSRSTSSRPLPRQTSRTELLRLIRGGEDTFPRAEGKALKHRKNHAELLRWPTLAAA